MVNRQLFYINFMFALFFVILGIISFFKATELSSSTLLLLFSIWLLNMFLLFLFSYFSMLKYQHCKVFIFILYLLALIFGALFAMQFISNLPLANISIVLVLIFSFAILSFSYTPMYILGILYSLLWLGLFFYLNN